MAVRELESAPGAASLYPRALAGATLLPALRRLPGLSRPQGLPDAELALRGIEIDRERLVAYDRVCGFRLRDELPPTYPHMLAFPLSMRLMTDRAFPFGPIGLVHIENRISQRRAIGAGERLDVRVRAQDLRPHDKGTQFDVVAEVEASGEPVWSSTSTYLRREGSGGGSQKGGGDRAEPPRASAVWKLEADLGRRYAAVSGDANPIHLHPLSAKLFGMPGHIAHGMWAKARCLAALEGRLPDALEVRVRFKLPVVLPAKVAFSSAPSDGGRAFALHDARTGKPHLEGVAR